MKHQSKKGFTLIEIALFLGISAMLVVGIILSTRNSIEEQRYNDSVQNFVDFLRNLYSRASNIEIENRVDNSSVQENGRTDKAVYGKLVTFGESTNLDGKENANGEIFVYDVVGGAKGTLGGGGDILSALVKLEAKVTTTKTESSQNFLSYYGNPQSYTINWDAKAEIAASKNNFKGALLIIRSPMSGTIYTYTLSTANNNRTVEVNEMVGNGDISAEDPLRTALKAGVFASQDINFCIRPEGFSLYNGLRRNVRINASAHNSASVELIPLNEEKNGNKGNQCERV